MVNDIDNVKSRSRHKGNYSDQLSHSDHDDKLNKTEAVYYGCYLSD